ncbi:LicD family protein [Methanobrevibacter sp.]
MKYREYDDDTLKHLQNLLLMILNDIKVVCDENNINYYIYAGSGIGVARHGGFIPWDDDVDIVMFRKDFNRFSEIFDEEFGDKYSLRTPDNTEDYFLSFPKVILNGTKYELWWSEKVSFETGIYLDIFILDNMPSNNLKRAIFTNECYFKKLLKDISFLKKHNDSSKTKQLIMDVVNLFLKIFRLDYLKLKKICLKTYVRYQNEETEYVADLDGNGHFKPHIFLRSDFEPADKFKFESIEVKVPNNLDGILTQIYGDYMEMPPKEKRYNHVPSNLDFGDY